MDLKDLGVSLIPLAAFWTMFTSLIASAKETNVIRDRIVTGTIDGKAISSRHRRVLFNDWKAFNTATIVGACLFFVVIAVVGAYLLCNQLRVAGWLCLLVSTAPLIAAAINVVCLPKDLELIHSALKAATATEADRGETV